MEPTTDPFELVVEIHDPIERHLIDSGFAGSWRPTTGVWRFNFGERNSVELLSEAPSTIDLRTSINALSRWWLGVLPATALGVTGQMEADSAVLRRLDGVTACLPRPHPGWDF